MNASTPVSKQHSTTPRQLDLQSNPEKQQDSPLGDSSSEEDGVQLRRPRKRLNAALDSEDSEQNDNREDTQTSKGSPDAQTPKLTKKLKVIKTEDDAVPLPDPFPLPKYYRADVEIALASGKMTKETMSAFLSAVAGAMLVYKRYPTRDDYVCVARTVVQKYNFMSSPVGTPHVSALQKSPTA